MRIWLVLLAVAGLADAHAQTLGGCAQGREMGYATAAASSWMRTWRGGHTAERRLIPGVELRVCRFEGDAAVVTVWARGTGYTVARRDIGPVRPAPTLREITDWDVACTGREIERVQAAYGAAQDWHLYDLAWDRDVSLTLLGQIRVEYARRMRRQGAVPPCDQVLNTGPPNRHLRRDVVVSLGRLAQAPLAAQDSLSGYSVHDYVVHTGSDPVQVLLQTGGVALLAILDDATFESEAPRSVSVLSQEATFAWNAPDGVGRETWTVSPPPSGRLRLRVAHSGSAAASWATSSYRLTVSREPENEP